MQLVGCNDTDSLAEPAASLSQADDRSVQRRVSGGFRCPYPCLSMASLKAAQEHCAGNSVTQQACGTCAASGSDSKWESRLPQGRGPDTPTSNAFILGLHSNLQVALQVKSRRLQQALAPVSRPARITANQVHCKQERSVHNRHLSLLLSTKTVFMMLKALNVSFFSFYCSSVQPLQASMCYQMPWNHACRCYLAVMLSCFT